MFHAAVFTLALCSVVYELLLGQTMAAFLGDTVTRYSVTIGLYMASMGFGAMAVRGRFLRAPVVTLQWVELALTVLGGCSVALVFAIEALTGSHLAIGLLAHTLVIVIGLLTGAEIPLLIAIRKGDRDRAESTVLGVDYLGAFAGTLAFAFVLYPIAGIVMTAFAVAALNAAVGVWLSTRLDQVAPQRRKAHAKLLMAQAFLFLGLVVGIAQSGAVENVLIGWYLGGSV